MNANPTLYVLIPGLVPPAPRPRFSLMPIKKFVEIARVVDGGSMKALLGCFRPHVYTPKDAKYSEWKRAAAWRLHAARTAYCGTRPFVNKGEAVEVRMLIVMPLPKGEHRKTEAKRPIRDWLVSKFRGDTDNLMKGPLDAATGVIWHDDSQVASVQVEKIVGAQFEDPRLELMVWKLDRRDAQTTNFEQARDAIRSMDCLYEPETRKEPQWPEPKTENLPF